MRNSVPRSASVAGLAWVIAFGCRSGAAPAAPHGAATTSPNASDAGWPQCGALVAFPTEEAPEQLLFLRPGSPTAPAVERYWVVDELRPPRQLADFASWWICVTDGRIAEPPDPDPKRQEPGRIEIRDLAVDQSNAERGME